MATHPEPQVPASVRRRELRAGCRQTRWLGLEIIRVGGAGKVRLRERSVSSPGIRPQISVEVCRKPRCSSVAMGAPRANGSTFAPLTDTLWR